jgi:ubiquinone/menaquinone biosynthesis C-methylase UbiE
MNCYLLYNKLIPKLTQRGRFQRVLDAGCGSGLQTIQLARCSEEVVGLDISAGLIEVAREQCAGLANVSFVVESVTKMPFEDESFDAIFSYGDVVSHILADYEKAIAEFARVAKRGALVSFEVDNKWNFGIFYHPRELWDALKIRGRGHSSRVWKGMFFKTFTHHELRSLLKRYDLELLEYHGHNIFASVIPDRYVLEEGERSFLGSIALWLGRLDNSLSGIFPFNRFGFNIVAVALKR